MAVIDCIRRFDFQMIPSAQKCSTALTPFNISWQICKWSAFKQKQTLIRISVEKVTQSSSFLTQKLSYFLLTEGLFWFGKYPDEACQVCKTYDNFKLYLGMNLCHWKSIFQRPQMHRKTWRNLQLDCLSFIVHLFALKFFTTYRIQL